VAADAVALGDLAPASGRASCKRGVAFGRHSVADMQALSKGVSWWYNWATRPDTGIGDAYRRLGVEFVPMIWGGRFNVDEAVAAIPSDAKYLLGFNEPNFGTQANLTVAQAVMLWPRVEEIARRRNLKLVSPATNYCGTRCVDTDPFRWMDQFIAACPACQFDYVATHLYSCYAAGLRGHLTRLKKYGKPIWVTEFACESDATPNVANQTRYMKEALALLESDPDVFRYSWFTGRTTSIAGASLLGDSGVLTPLGEQYVTLPYTTACGR
jgi:hypothetical protein